MSADSIVVRINSSPLLRILELDPEPYQVQVAIKQAAVDTVQANLVLAQANVRGSSQPGKKSAL